MLLEKYRKKRLLKICQTPKYQHFNLKQLFFQIEYKDHTFFLIEQQIKEIIL